MRNGAFFFIAVAAVLILAFWLDDAQAHQEATLTGEANADTAVLIDNSRGKVEASKIPDRVPDAIAPSYPSAYNCAMGGGVALGIKGLGISGGGHRESEECNIRADSIMAHKLGAEATAFELMCSKYRFYTANVRARAHGNSQIMTCVPNKAHNDRYKQELADEYYEDNRTSYDRMMEGQ